jgi:hypothetical protein
MIQMLSPIDDRNASHWYNRETDFGVNTTASGRSYSLNSDGLTEIWKALRMDITDHRDDGICSVKPTKLSRRWYMVKAS